MTEALTSFVKYIFLDVVGFTHRRSVEAQSDIVAILNQIVKESLASASIPDDKLVLLPTGDGMCIGIMDMEHPYDVHITTALTILGEVAKHNDASDDEMRRFSVRVGINANLDNVVTDINGKRNLAGAGINNAQRVMSQADGGQILVGHMVYETLRHRELYMQSFRSFTAVVKHDLRMSVHQFVEEGRIGLNNELPTVFQSERTRPQESKLSLRVAHYFAQAMIHRESITPYANQITISYGITILLWYLALDSINRERASEINRPQPITYKAGTATFAEQIEYYNRIDLEVRRDFAETIERDLGPFAHCFEESLWLSHHFVNGYGANKLKNEYPHLWSSMDLDRDYGVTCTEPVAEKKQQG
jgi:class 3 adenylate cyclase